MRVIVAIHQARSLGVEHVGPAVLGRGDPEGPAGDRVGERNVVAVVVGRSVGDVDIRARARTKDLLDRLEVSPELSFGCLGHTAVSLWPRMASGPTLRGPTPPRRKRALSNKRHARASKPHGGSQSILRHE